MSDFFISENKLCPLFREVCQREHCIAYNVNREEYYSTNALEITEIQIPFKKNTLYYRIYEGIIDKKEVAIHHSCKQYDYSFIEIEQEDINIPFVDHGYYEQGFLNKHLYYQEKWVNARDPRKNNIKYMKATELEKISGKGQWIEEHEK